MITKETPLTYTDNYSTTENAKLKLKENPEKWKSNEDGIALSEEDSIILIKNSVTIDIEVAVEFVSKNSNAYIIGQITPGNSPKVILS